MGLSRPGPGAQGPFRRTLGAGDARSGFRRQFGSETDPQDAKSTSVGAPRRRISPRIQLPLPFGPEPYTFFRVFPPGAEFRSGISPRNLTRTAGLGPRGPRGPKGAQGGPRGAQGGPGGPWGPMGPMGPGPMLTYVTLRGPWAHGPWAHVNVRYTPWALGPGPVPANIGSRGRRPGLPTPIWRRNPPSGRQIQIRDRPQAQNFTANPAAVAVWPGTAPHPTPPVDNRASHTGE